MDKFTLERSEVLLLIIDIQERLVPAMKFGNKVIDNTKILVEVSNALDIPMIVTEQYTKGLGNTVSDISNCINNSAFHEKNSFTGCTAGVASAMKETKRKKIIICGMETHVCVFQTARDLLKLGYQVFVVGDGVCSRSKENYLNGLRLMENMGAIITNTETVFFDLMKEAGTPEFKQLSKLVR